MRGDFDEDEYDDADFFVDVCNTCAGKGVIVTCIDDMCRGSGECMHGDGERACPDCGGECTGCVNDRSRS